jgi:hypothetical protein
VSAGNPRVFASLHSQANVGDDHAVMEYGADRARQGPNTARLPAYNFFLRRSGAARPPAPATKKPPAEELRRGRRREKPPIRDAMHGSGPAPTRQRIANRTARLPRLNIRSIRP